ncbi:MAG: competence/damage-inducible protein A [bacterium]|nr:competence/damage-inducible protein A [bacterium]
MQAEIISIGTELTLGQIVDTNAGYLSQQLSALGFEVYYRSTVADNEPRIIETIKTALARNELVVICGGLGPTQDDITRDAVAKSANAPLEFHPELLEIITAYFARVRPGQVMPVNNQSQAFIPQGALYFVNQRGTAPGLLLELDKKLIVVLPGPPRELKPIWEEQVVPTLQKRFKLNPVIKYRVLKVVGMPESAIDEKIKDFMIPGSNPEVGLMAEPGEIAIRLTARAESELAVNALIGNVEQVIRSRLGETIFGVDKETLESVVGQLLRQKQLRVSVAESCTGGLIAHRLTNVSGSSDYFDRGVVVYSNQAKQELLGVPAETLSKFGAVSEPTALAMVQGLLKRAGTDAAIAVTGIAGPTGGTPEKPVGLVYIALADLQNYQNCVKCNFIGERELIKWRTSQEALDLLRRYLLRRI